MASSPFGCNKKSSFGSPFKGKEKASPPEDVTLIADKSQVITAIIPFGTKVSPAIRQFMHANILCPEKKRIFIYRDGNGWTNIDLKSTEQTPMLTANPIYCLKTAYTAFNDCPQVKDVIIKWTDGTVVSDYDAIDDMDGQFIDLPTATEAEESSSKSEGEVLHEMLAYVMKKMDTLDQRMTIMHEYNESSLKKLRDEQGKSSTASVGESSSTAGKSTIDISGDDKSVDADVPTRNAGKRKARR